MTVILRPAQNHNLSPNWLSHVSVCLPYSDVWILKAPVMLIDYHCDSPTVGASQGLNEELYQLV